MNISDSAFLSINQVQDQYLSSSKTGQQLSNLSGNGISFDEALENAKSGQTEIKFSKHAAGRMSERNMELTDDQMTRLNDAKNQASQKGINESLIMLDQMAFIVNVPNNTVVTALDSNDNSQKVFTNIDGAVIA